MPSSTTVISAWRIGVLRRGGMGRGGCYGGVMRELEIRFHVPSASLLALRQELRRHGARSSRVSTHYFDTPADVLDSQRLSLRLCKQGQRWFQTLQFERGGSLGRVEHDVALRVPPGTMPVLELVHHDGTEAGARLRESLGGAGAGELVERFTADVTRLACRLSLPGATVEAALDIGLLRAGERQAPICELELAYRSGDSAPLFALAQLWRRHGGLWLDARSKPSRGTLLAKGLDGGTPVRGRAPMQLRDMDGSRLLRAVMQPVLEQVLASASDLAAGGSAPESLHQLRVGLRRLRTALRELQSLAEGVDPGWEPVLRAAFAQLGAIRDDQAVAAAVRPLLERANAPKLVWSPVDAAADPGAIVRADTFQDTLLDLLRWVQSESIAIVPAHGPGRVRHDVAERLSRLHRQVTRGGKVFEQLPQAQQHQVRKRLKRLRYLAEFVGELWPRKAVRRYLRRLSPAQDALGQHNDVAVAGAKFLADARQDPLSLFAAGYLKAHQAVTAHQARAALVQVACSPCFWMD